MYSRPKTTETDEDILRLQKDFLQNKNQIKLAATVVSEKPDENHENNAFGGIPEDSYIDIQNQLGNTFEDIPTNESLGLIVEKNAEVPKLPLKFTNDRGFPKAKRRDPNISGNFGGSIFAQQAKKLKIEAEPMSVDHASQATPQPSTSKKIVKLPKQSFVVMGPDRNQIHEENVHKLRNMTEKEILEERENLKSMMDPALITFLQSKRKLQSGGFVNPTIQEQNEAAQSVDVNELETPNEVLRQPNSDRWLNFGTVEANKLAWMKDVQLPKLTKAQAFEARFDFEGWLMPYTENEITEKSRTLYHHGEEAGRPGYTLQELFQLARSNVTQQKIVALNTIANILHLNSTGVFVDIIDLPIEQIFFVLRFSVDDNTPSVLNAATKAMRNLVYNNVDESCLNCLLGFGLGRVQPILAIDHDDEDDNTVNDQQLVEKNLIKCIIRTDILTRIRYILDTVKPTAETVSYCVDILTRLARDSNFVVAKMFKCERLLKILCYYFHPSNEPVPNIAWLQIAKLMITLFCRDKYITALLTKTCVPEIVVDAAVLHLSSDVHLSNTDTAKVQTECYHLWAIFLQKGREMDLLRSLEPYIINHLRFHFNTTDLDMQKRYTRLQHAASILFLLAHAAENQLNAISPFLKILEECFSKWMKQFATLEQFPCDRLQLISCVYQCLTVIWKYKHSIPAQSRDTPEKLTLALIKSAGFATVTKTIKNSSMLLNNYEVHKSNPNLKTLETAAWHASEHIIPIMKTDSPLPFLTALSNYIRTTDNCDIKLTFLKSKHIQDYIKALTQTGRLHLTNHWFTRIESQFIINILKMSVAVRQDLDTAAFYELAVKCLSIFSADQKPDIEFILVNIIFSSQFYPSEVLMCNLDIDSRSDSLDLSLKHLDEILTVYVQVLGLKNNIPKVSVYSSLDVEAVSVIPVDWIYTPIVVMYSNQQQNKQALSETDQVFTIRNCLRWILIYETYFPELAATINPTDRYCRIGCVFLGSDSLFLIPEIHSLLELCFGNIISKYEHKINFNGDIQGLTSFQDFFTQLLEQYQGVSYGDILFGNFIMVPLAQRHNVKWRKTLWSEYMGAVETFNVTTEQLVCPVDLFINPTEEDLSLLKCYRRAIVNNSVRKHSVLYAIAKHHVEEHIVKTSSRKDRK